MKSRDKRSFNSRRRTACGSLFFVLLLTLFLFSPAIAAIHVAPTGDDAADGSKARPVATIARAVELADALGGEQTIELAAGVYREIVELPARAGAPALTITAAPDRAGGFERVVFDYGFGTDGAEPVEGMPGVYRMPIPPGYNAYRSRRSMWEADTRTRYRRMADLRAVAAYPASFRIAPDEYFSPSGWVYFHTSDGRSPASHEIGLSIDLAFTIERADVTVRGVRVNSGHGFRVIGANTCLEDCGAWNIERMAVYISAACPRATVRRFTGTDVGAGIYSEAKHTVVEDCRLFRPNDDFESHARTQMDSMGIQLYSPAVTGEIRGNLVVGFRAGIFLKKGKGGVVIEHNTVYGGGGDGSAGGLSGGIYPVWWHAGTVVRNNIVSGHAPACVMGGFTDYGTDVVFQNNVLWNEKQDQGVEGYREIALPADTGDGIVMADPRFAAPALGDFRLLPDSPALRSGGAPIGAFGRVPDDWEDAESPAVTLRLAAPATILDAPLDGMALDDARQHSWLVPHAQANLHLDAVDNASPIVRMQVKVGGGEWSAPMEFATTLTVQLPANDKEAMIAVRVVDAAGNESRPARVRVFRVEQPPQIIGEIHRYISRQGLIVAFRSSVPCHSRIEREGADPAPAQPEGPPRLHHVLAVQTPEVAPGAEFRYRIVLDDGVGHQHRTDSARVVLDGAPRTISLDPAGIDRDGSDGPWRSLQFAVDRALPGDQILLADGVYPGATVVIRRGGTPDAPLRIAARNAGRATLDGGKAHPFIVQIEGAPHVTLDGLEIRWFLDSGVLITDSPHVILEHLTVWNEHRIKGRVVGDGIFVENSPHLTIRHSLFFYMNRAFWIRFSPNFHVAHNTFATQVHNGGRLNDSTRNSTMINNCFAFTGNEHILAHESKEDWETFTLDYNNYPAVIRDIAVKRPASDVDIAHPGVWAKTAKRVIRLYLSDERMDGFSLAEWQELSGKDAHSIFKRPLFVNPLENDWRIRPDSPNIGAGKNGATIGAPGVAEQMQ